MPNFDWQIIHRFASGHKYFRDKVSGRDAIADMSGARPHLTDDGVLWLDLTRNPVLNVWGDHRGIHIPLTCEDGSPSRTPCSLDEGVWFARTYSKLLEFTMRGELYTLNANWFRTHDDALSVIKRGFKDSDHDNLHKHEASRIWTNIEIMEESLAENRG